MTLRIAINGYGRIGRLVHRALIEHGYDDIDLVAVNGTADANANLHLLKYDSVHGRLQAEATAPDEDTMIVAGKQIQVFQERDPLDLPWGTLDIDVVLECTGKFTKRDGAMKHIEAGAKKVLISAPATDEDITVVYGVNHDRITKDHLIVSNASCTTNCLAPVVQVLHEQFGIESGFMTTIHAYTGDQNTVDSNHKDLHRARAAAVNMIPTSTGAAKAVGRVLPALQGRLDGVAIRVPTPNVSMIDLTANVSRETNIEQINQAMIEASEGSMKNILGVYNEPLVSSDFNHDPHSAIVSLAGTKVMDGGKLIRVMAWYDNEWGFSLRMLDVARTMGKIA